MVFLVALLPKIGLGFVCFGGLGFGVWGSHFYVGILDDTEEQSRVGGFRVQPIIFIALY